MSTRSQVLIVTTPQGDGGKVRQALYHHYDGYPGNMLALLQAARERVEMRANEVARDVLEAQREVYAAREAAGFKGAALNPSGYNPERHAADAKARELSRGADRMTNWIIAADPDGYEIEPAATLHGDLEFLYRVAAPALDIQNADAPREWMVRVEAFRFSDEDRERQLSSRRGRVVLDWTPIDSRDVDAEIEAHEKRVADYQAKYAAELAK